jgi:hypothetical protein
MSFLGFGSQPPPPPPQPLTMADTLFGRSTSSTPSAGGGLSYPANGWGKPTQAMPVQNTGQYATDYFNQFPANNRTSNAPYQTQGMVGQYLPYSVNMSGPSKLVGSSQYSPNFNQQAIRPYETLTKPGARSSGQWTAGVQSSAGGSSNRGINSPFTTLNPLMAAPVLVKGQDNRPMFDKLNMGIANLTDQQLAAIDNQKDSIFGTAAMEFANAFANKDYAKRALELQNQQRLGNRGIALEGSVPPAIDPGYLFNQQNTANWLQQSYGQLYDRLNEARLL